MQTQKTKLNIIAFLCSLDEEYLESFFVNIFKL